MALASLSSKVLVHVYIYIYIYVPLFQAVACFCFPIFPCLRQGSFAKDPNNVKVLERQGRIFLALDDLDAASSVVTRLNL